MTDTVTYFSDQHLTWLSQLKPNANVRICLRRRSPTPPGLQCTCIAVRLLCTACPVLGPVARQTAAPGRPPPLTRAGSLASPPPGGSTGRRRRRRRGSRSPRGYIDIRDPHTPTPLSGERRGIRTIRQQTY